MTDIGLQLRERLVNGLSPVELDIIDESNLHVGHAGSSNGAHHFFIRIISTHFEGINRVSRHRLIYALVDDLMPYPIHALRIEALNVL